ncbi:MAG: sodium:solute symporter family protein [Woeseiaceae bacterium]
MGTIDTGIVLAYLAMMVAIGLYASRKQGSVEDYFVASGKIGTFSISCLWLASWIGGASVVAGASNAYHSGISAGWYIGSMVIGCVLFGLFFAARVNRIGRQNKLLTYPDMIESRYDSRTRIVATVTTILAYLGYAAGQIAASALVLQTLLGMEYEAALLLSAGIIVVYTATGGFLAITFTDWVQVSILFFGVAIIGIPVAIANGGSWSTLTTSLPERYFDVGGMGWPTILAMVVSISLSFFTAMDNYTRCFAARSEQTARRGALIASALLVPLLVGTVWMGLTTQVLIPNMADSGDVLTRFVIEYFPIGLKGLLLVGILAALMSTADICILTASANATRDIYQRYLNPSVEPKRLLRLSMIASAVIGAGATLMAWLMQDVLSILLVAFTVNSAALFLPSIAMVYFKHVSKRAAFWSICCALGVVVAWYGIAQFSQAGLFALDPLWPGLLVSVVVFTIISRMERHTLPAPAAE